MTFIYQMHFLLSQNTLKNAERLDVLMKHNFAYYSLLLFLTTILLLLTGCGNTGTHTNTLSVSGVNPDSSEPLTLEMFKEDATPYLGRTLEDIQEALGDALKAPEADEDPHNYWVNVGVNLCFNDAYRCIGMETYTDAMPLLSGMLDHSKDEAYDALMSAGFTCSDEYENPNDGSIVPRLSLDEGKYGIVATSDNYCYMVRDIDKKAQPKAALSWLDRGTYCPQDMQKLDLADWIGISHEECRDKYHVDTNDWLDYINGGGIITVGFTSEDDDGLIFDLSAYNRDFSFLGVPLSLEPKDLCAELEKIKGVSTHYLEEDDCVFGENDILSWEIDFNNFSEEQPFCFWLKVKQPELLKEYMSGGSLTQQILEGQRVNESEGTETDAPEELKLNTALLDLIGLNTNQLEALYGPSTGSVGNDCYQYGEDLICGMSDVGTCMTVTSSVKNIISGIEKAISLDEVRSLFGSAEVGYNEMDKCWCVEAAYNGYYLLIYGVDSDGTVYADSTFLYNINNPIVGNGGQIGEITAQNESTSAGDLSGIWTYEDDIASTELSVTKISNTTIKCDLSTCQVSPPYRNAAATGVTFELNSEGQYVAHSFSDSWDNVFDGTITFDGDTATVETNVIQISQLANYGLTMSETLTHQK